MLTATEDYLFTCPHSEADLVRLLQQSLPSATNAAVIALIQHARKRDGRTMCVLLNVTSLRVNEIAILTCLAKATGLKAELEVQYLGARGFFLTLAAG